MQSVQVENSSEIARKRVLSSYQTVWRWHFYAGIIFAPFLFVLAVTGAIYLFKPEIEQALYKQYYDVEVQEDRITASEQLAAVATAYPNAQLTKYRPGDRPSRSSEVKIVESGKSLTIFVNPYTGEVIGELHDTDRIMAKIEDIHGELMSGTIGDRLVELAACWAVVLIVTGLFLWWPKAESKVFGVLIPRFKQGKRMLRRDLHAVPAFWLTAGMLFLIMTGLPWSGFWGSHFQTMATNSGAGYPPSVWVGNAPTSTIQTKEIAEVPWAAETLAVPASSIQGFIPISIDDVVEIAKREGIYPGYTVVLPKKPEGVYTLSVFPPKAQDEATMHIDQYSGAVLADYRYDHYGVIGKVVAWGITLHKGTQFGLTNQLVSLFICIGIMFVVVSGIYLWWKRKPQKTMGAPKATSIRRMKSFLALMIGLSVLFPLVGLSLIIVWVLDWALIQRIPVVKQFLHA